jgi:hypothetical protein
MLLSLASSSCRKILGEFFMGLPSAISCPSLL